MTEEGDSKREASGDEEELLARVRAAEDRAEEIYAAPAGTPQDGTIKPRYITPNQIVAYNMAYFRKAAGLTQGELGERLSGWTSRPWPKAAVSAVERSWDGKQRRQFDADLIFGLSAALGVPIAAFFLPPNVDGGSGGYAVLAPHEPEGGRSASWSAGAWRMDEYARHVLSEPGTALPPGADKEDQEEPVSRAYRARYNAMRSEFFGLSLAPESYFDDLTTEEQLAERALRLRAHHDALREIAKDISTTLDYVLDRYDEAREKEEQKQPRLKQLRREEIQRRSQAELDDLSRKIFALHREGKSIGEIQEVLPYEEETIRYYLEKGRELAGEGDEAT